MAAIILPHRLRVQPQDRPLLDLGNPLLNGVTELVIPTHRKTLVRGADVIQQNAALSQIRASRAGMAFSLDASVSNVGYKFGTANDVLQSLTTATLFFYRRSRDTTARANMLAGSFPSTGATSTLNVQVRAPHSDGVFYWDYGGSTNGRLTVSFTKSTEPETLVVIAGPSKGREIWRNGVKIASNSGTTGSRSSSTNDFGIGGNGATAQGTDNDDVYLFGAVAREWSDAEVREWSNNPWSIFRSPSRRIWLPPATASNLSGGTSGASSAAGTLAVASSAAITTSGASTAAAAITVAADTTATTSSASTSDAAVTVASDASTSTSSASTTDGAASAFDGANGSTSSAQSTAGALAVASQGDVATSSASSSSASAVVSSTLAGDTAGASSAAGTLAAATVATSSTSSATTADAQAGVASSAAVATASAGTTAGGLRAEEPDAAETGSASTTAGTLAGGVGVRVAASSAQSTAGALAVAVDFSVSTGSASSMQYGALVLSIDGAGSTASVGGTVAGALIERDPNEVAIIVAAVDARPAVAGAVRVRASELALRRIHVARAVGGEPSINESVGGLPAARPATAGAATARPA